MLDAHRDYIAERLQSALPEVIRVYSQIATVGTERRNVRWSKAASNLLQTDMKKFLQQCGTRYVRGVFAGHMLDESVHFQLTAKSHSTSDATSLSVGVANLFSASAAFSDADASYSQIATVTLTSYGKGALSVPPLPSPAPAPQGGAAPGGSPPPAHAADAPDKPKSDKPADGGNQPGGPSSSASSSSSATAGGSGAPLSPLATMVNYYNTGFTDAVTTAPKSTAVPLYITTERYRGKLGLSGTNKIPVWADDLMALVVARSDTYDDLVTAISDLKFALSQGVYSRLATFYKEDDATAKQKQTAAKQLLVDFQKAVKGCQDLLTANKETVPNPDAPGKNVSAVTLCQRKLDVSLTDDKVAAVKLTRVYAEAKL